MALKRIKITEAQAFDLLLEAASLGDVYQKYYNQIPEEEFRQIVAADPTSGEDKMGKYSKWLLALYTGGNLKLEDLYKATQYLTIFHKYKQKLQRKDIGQYKSLPDLYKEIKPYENNTQAASHNEEIRQMKEGAEKVYEDNEWLIVVPHTKDAAIFYGKGTQWCTAATESGNYFDSYNSEGPLYININKKTGRKFQFHFPSQQFMNEEDREVYGYDDPVYVNVGLSNGAVNYYRSAVGNDVIYILCPGEVYKVEGTSDLYITHYGTTLQQMVDGVEHVLCHCDEGDFENELVFNRYIFIEKSVNNKEKINVFDIKEKNYVFAQEEIRCIVVITEDMRYLQVAKSFTGENKIYDLKVGDWLDTDAGDYCVESLRNSCGYLYKDSLVLIRQDEGLCILDLNKDKIISDCYNESATHYTSLFDDYDGYEYRFRLLYLGNDLRSFNLGEDTVVVLYDGTIIPFNEYKIKYKEYFKKILSETGLTVRVRDLWYKNTYGRY